MLHKIICRLMLGCLFFCLLAALAMAGTTEKSPAA